MARGRHGRLVSLGRTTLVWCGVIFTMTPIVWLVVSSFKNEGDIFTMPPKWWFSPTTIHYRVALARLGVERSLMNSGAVAAAVTALALVLGSLAAYALARYRVAGGGAWLGLVLVTRAVPPIVTVIPFFLLYQSVGILDTRLGVTLAHSSLAIPLVIWLMRAFFLGVPRELEEAAMVDGCSEMGAIARVTMPLAVPGFIAAGILTFIDSWNEFIMAYILTSERARTLPVSIAGFIAERSTEYGPMFASGVLAMLPVVAAVVVLQRRVFSGMTVGALR